MIDLRQIGEKILQGGSLSREEAREAFSLPQAELFALLDVAFRIRSRFWGTSVILHVLCNAKSGSCHEDCGYCRQSGDRVKDIPRHGLLDPGSIFDGAERAAAIGARKYCIVTSGKCPSEKDLRILCEVVERIKSKTALKVCVSLGLITPEQATILRRAGVDRYNHNLETSRRHFPALCGTHCYEDRVRTIKIAQAAGMEVCSGGIMGVGESVEDRIDLAFALRELAVDAIPVNFFMPFPESPLRGIAAPLTPTEALKTLAVFRLANPSCDLRVAAGREETLRSLQPLALFAVNSMFTEGYLTTPGQGLESDMKMITDAGFTIDAIES